jgi:molybdopterin-containing oxidoreductase family membrane subunit
MAEPAHDELGGQHTYESVTDAVMQNAFRSPGAWWGIALSIAAMLVVLFVVGVTYLFATGIGIFGNNIPVAWGFPIATFVWWIGIGHAGTFISAFLFLMRQEWRNSINRVAEAMTLFAVLCAGIYPLLHLGRPWFFYWILPYPNTMELWPQWRSPLVWDVFAVGTYFTVSLLFWYLGLIPDVATLRDRADKRWQQVLYGLLAMGWRNSESHWRRHQAGYLLLAGLATPLVISVHSIVGLDFAVANLPGWHSTLFPPYFVAGALFSGFAMVLTITIPLRKLFGLKEVITMRHLELLAKMMLTTGLIVAFSYVLEHFLGWYSGDPYEMGMLVDRLTGPYAPGYWLLMFCNVVVPQLVWFKKVRGHVPTLFVISILVNVGMWLERVMIVVTSLHHDFLPSSWDMFIPTFWDWAILAGTIGIFSTLMFLFIRFLPTVATYEVREQLSEDTEHHLDEDATVLETTAPSQSDVWGLAGRFADRDVYRQAMDAVRDAGYTAIEGYTPFPVEDREPGESRHTLIPMLALGGGLLGGVGAFVMQTYASVWSYPWNVGGRPDFSWPSFVPLTFELTVLGAAITIFLAVLLLNRLPRFHHPIFATRGFSRASTDAFWISVEATDPQFDRAAIRKLLNELGARTVEEVPCE